MRDCKLSRTTNNVVCPCLVADTFYLYLCICVYSIDQLVSKYCPFQSIITLKLWAKLLTNCWKMKKRPFGFSVLAIKILFLRQTYKNAAVSKDFGQLLSYGLTTFYIVYCWLLILVHLKTEVQTDCFAFNNKLTTKFLKQIVDVINWENFFVHNASGFIIQMETIMDIYHCCSSEKTILRGRATPPLRGYCRTLSLQLWNSYRSRINGHSLHTWQKFCK